MSASLTPAISPRRTSRSSRNDNSRGKAPRADAARANIRGGEATRQKLIEVAGRVFAEHGYYAATVRDICAQAGHNVAAVNYHFRDKLGLYTEVLLQSARASNVQVMQDALDQDAPPEQILRDVIRARLSGVCRGDAANQKLRILLHELSQPTPAIDRILREVTQPIYQRMLAVVGELIALPPQDETTRLCAHSVIGQIMLYALAGPLFARLWQGFKMTPQRTERIAEHIADFSMAYMREVAAKYRQSAAAKPRTGLRETLPRAKSQARRRK